MNDKHTVIVVDDEPVTRMDISEMMQEIGFTVKGTAADGFDAVELCRLHKPGVVLMDIKMPTFDGLTAADTIIRENLADCVVLLTAYNNRELIERAKRIGVTGYLVKPIDQRMLLPAIEVAMAQSARLRESREEAALAQRQIKMGKIIDRAKALLAEQYGVSEAEAYSNLRKMAMDKRCTVASLAQAIVSSNSKREIINRAKNILMKVKGMSEDAAYCFIRDEAKRRNCKTEDYARIIVENQK